MVITLDELRTLKACKEGLRDFKDAFGESAEVTRGSLARMGKHVDWLAQSHPEISRYHDAYMTLVAPARKEHARAMDPHWDEYLATTRPHEEAYEKVASLPSNGDVHYRAYQEALRPHRERYEAAFHDVLRTYHDASAKALADAMGLQSCDHEYVNVGFNSMVMACRHCGKGK